MTSHSEKSNQKRRAASEGAARRHISFKRKPEHFSQEFDLRTMSHEPGSRPAGALQRPKALRPSPQAAKKAADFDRVMTWALGMAGVDVNAQAGQPGARASSSANIDPDSSWKVAADNALELEWVSARDELERLAHHSMTAAEAGVRLQALLRRVPSLLADELGALLTSDVEGGGESSKKKELLPLPLPRCKLVRDSELTTLFQSDKVLCPKAKELGAVAWQHLLAAALNGLDSHGNCVSFFGPPTEAQSKALHSLLQDCRRFVSDGSARTPTDFGKELGAKTQSYWGEPVYCAEDITLAQVLPTLPAQGVAASVDICRVLEGQIRDQLRDPDSLLLPEEEWPAEVPKARTMLKDKREWGSLANELWQRDLTLWMPRELIFTVRGVPIISGLFGVNKGKDVPGSPGLSQLRLICNLVPSNGFFREIRGDVEHLPYMLQWATLILKDDEVLLISQEDMTCAFYLFRLPRAWCRFFAIGFPIKLADLTGNARARDQSVSMAGGACTSGLGYLVLQVLPMGWKSAVGIMQAVHRRLLASSLAKGSRLPSGEEIRKTAPMPPSEDQRTLRGWQVYLDNYASFIIARIREAEAMEGQASEWHAKARAAWEMWNIPSATDKSVANAFTAKELGCHIDGRAGTLGTTVQRRLDAIALTLFLVSCRNPHRMWLAVASGRWSFIFQFRRAASSCFHLVWRAISEWKNCRRLPREVCRELLTAVFLAPGLLTNLRSRPDLMLTVSDASSTGAAIGATAGLTDYGVWAAKSLPAQVADRIESGVALVSLFGGIEAGRRALDLIGVRVVRHVAVEQDKAAIRASSEIYPDIVHFRDVIEFSRGDLHGALAGVHILFVLILAGFPCQGLSGANATKKGFDDPRSRLFFHALRVVQEAKAEKHQVRFLFENVASMDAADRDLVSSYVGVRPVVVCASGMSQVRRKRYLWASWPIRSGLGVEVEEQEASWKVTLSAELPPSSQWVSPGWQMEGSPEVRFPTFMRALPKKKETFLPAGIASTPADARKRWRADAYRYPPYQYKREFCVRHKRNPRRLRVLCAEEREVTMFLGRGATRYALNPTAAKADPQALEDARNCLIGNTFHAGVFGVILGSLFHQAKLLPSSPTPQELVSRMGLHPGEIYVEGLDCSLTRPPTFHRLDSQRRGLLHASFEEARRARAAASSSDLELLSLNALLRGADYRGSDVRLDVGELTKPNQWPRRSLDPAKWVWYPVLAHPYHDEEHINILEVRAAHLTLRWRARTGARLGSRFFHLLDSQVAIAVLAKGRSSSWKMNQVLRRVSALTIAAGFLPAYGYVMSTWNPIDGPSRKWESGQLSRGATPRRARPRKARPKVKKDLAPRRNRKFVKKFDSTLGYPGEGPARPTDRRVGRSRLKVMAKVKARFIERVPIRRTQSERAAARRGIQLRDGVLAPSTRRLYYEAFVRLWSWVGVSPPDHVESVSAYDRLLAAYIEEAWSSGLTRGDAGNSLSASLTVYRRLRGKGQLPESWYLLNAWARYEIPLRAPPMPAEVALALAWFFVRSGEPGGALLILLGFDCFLRTGELLSLTLDDIVFGSDGTGVVRLGHTKTGQRHAAFEASTINDPLCGAMFRAVLSKLPANTHSGNYIFRPRVWKFYSLFDKGLRWLDLEGWGFKPYSLRRGGATAFFRATRSMEAALDRGRWSSARVARIYLNDGLAKEVELRFSAATRSLINTKAEAMKLWLANF